MTKQKTPVEIRFVKPKGWEVMAVFMGKSADRYFNVNCGNHERTCYQHTGQHGVCSDNFARAKRATVTEYTPLLKELESLGYSVTVK